MNSLITSVSGVKILQLMIIFLWRRYFVAVMIVILLLQTSCIDNISEHGLAVKKEDLEKLRIGGSRQFIVKKLLGPASIEEVRDTRDIWFYVSYSKNKMPLRKSKLINYHVVELEFIDSKLHNIQKYDMDDLREISFNSKTTKYTKSNRNIFKQLLNNIGRFDGESDI